jgi:hypothetical protein
MHRVWYTLSGVRLLQKTAWEPGNLDPGTREPGTWEPQGLCRDWILSSEFFAYFIFQKFFAYFTPTLGTLVGKDLTQTTQNRQKGCGTVCQCVTMSVCGCGFVGLWGCGIWDMEY